MNWTVKNSFAQDTLWIVMIGSEWKLLLGGLHWKLSSNQHKTNHFPVKFALEALMKSAVLYQSFFSETGLENSREIPAKSAFFSHEFVPEHPAKFDHFFRDLPEALQELHTIDLFRLYILFSQYRSCDDTKEIWSFVLFIKKSIFMLACTLFNEQDKGSNLLSIITWSVLGKQNVQAKKVYS